MALVKLEIDGKRVTADTGQTILQAARQHGILTIPTLCHDEQLEPFSSCYVCVVKVKGAKSLLPACSTKVTAGMVVETNSTEVRQSRKAALELLLSDHYADCVGPCQLACPAGVDIQGYIALAAIGRYKDAIALIKDANPLPSVCGRVCTRPCEVSGCRRTLLDDAVGIDYIKRYISDLDLLGGDTWRPTPKPANGKRVAVVGAGPAGLSAAYYLALKGYAVEVFEAQPEAGGMLRYGIPEYRLPKDVLDLEIGQILGLGVRLKTNTKLGRDFTIASLKQQGFDAIFVGIGAWRSSAMRVQNENAPGVLSGIEFLEKFGRRQPIDIHGTVCVVGGGNTAIDCARTALRLGVKEVKLLYRRTRKEMPANEMEIHDAIEEGVTMEFLVAPTRIVSQADGTLKAIECQKMELGEPDASGRRSPKPVKGSEYEIPCDFVIAAIGQSTTVADLVDGKVPGFLPEGERLNLTKWQTVQVNEETFETSVEGLFSGGDVVTGAATAIEAIAAGRKAAYSIDTWLREGVVRPEPKEFISRKDVFSKVTTRDLRSLDSKPKRVMPLMPVSERVASFAEVELGYSADDIREETTRCLECGCVALFDCDLRNYATEYGADVKHFQGEARQHDRDITHPLIELDPNKCILCGRCVRICSDIVGVSAFGFINRGFGTVVAPAFGGSLLDTECVSCGLCVGTCPTGAIAERVPLAKPGPWITEPVSSVCAFCGVGCRITYETFGDTLVKVSRDEANPVTLGSYCKKGFFGGVHVHAKDRLLEARVQDDDKQGRLPVEAAVDVVGQRIKQARRQYAAHEMAVFVSPRLSNEEIYLAQKFARVVLGTNNVGSFSQLLNEALQAPEVLATASYQDLASADAILLTASNLDEEHFVVDLAAKRAIRSGAKLIAVGRADNRTASTAHLVLGCAPEAEELVVQAIVAAAARTPGTEGGVPHELVGAIAGRSIEQIEQATGVAWTAIEEAAAVLTEARRKVLVFNRDYRGARRPGDTRFYADAARALGCSLLPLHEAANGQGLFDMGADPRWLPGYRKVTDAAAATALEREWSASLPPAGDERGLAELLAAKQLKLVVILGEDPLGLAQLPSELRDGLLAADYLVAADVFETATTRAANVALPWTTTAETSGTFTSSERRVQRFERAIRPRAGFEGWELLSRMAVNAGEQFRLSYRDTSAIFDEIRRAVPLYGKVAVSDAGEAGVWPAADVAASSGEAGERTARAVVVPRATLPLDTLSVRFDEWFAAKMAAAPGTRV